MQQLLAFPPFSPPHSYLLIIVFSLIFAKDYPAEMYEIVTTDEWDLLADVAHAQVGLTDFSVRFSCDIEGILWNLDVCRLCNPFDMNRDSAR